MKIIESLPAERWAEYKQIKLDSITNEPIAFSEQLEKLQKKSDEDWKNDLQNAEADRMVYVFVEDESGTLVAFANGHTHQNKRLAHNAFLSNLYVRPGARQKGLGTQLIEKRIELLKAKYPEVKNIHCEIVTTQETSIAIHKKLGFTISGEIKDLFLIDNVLYSEYWLQKKIA